MNMNYKIHPFDDLKKRNCPWLDDMKQNVLRSISEYDAYINKEAETDNSIDLADEDKLYERFKNNVEFSMDCGNYVILKYFVLFFEKKILYNMIGENKFTDRDVEMYNYFLTHKFGDKYYKVSKIMRYINEDVPGFVGDEECSKAWVLALKHGKTIERINYIDLFVRQYVLCNDMVRNAKSLDLFAPDDNLFGSNNMFNLYDHDGLCYDNTTVFAVE